MAARLDAISLVSTSKVATVHASFPCQFFQHAGDVCGTSVQLNDLPVISGRCIEQCLQVHIVTHEPHRAIRE